MTKSEAEQERLHEHVVVGAADTEASRSAVRYAAREAAARRVVLELVHVVPLGSARDAVAADVLEEGRAVALAEVPGITVALTLLHGHGVDQLVARAADRPAPGGRCSHARADGAPASGVRGAGCRRAGAGPVVVVPPGAAPAGQLRRIVVGLKSPARDDDELLSPAFAEAQRHRAELAVVHAWQPSTPHPDATATAGTTRAGCRGRRRWSRSSWRRCGMRSRASSCGWTSYAETRPTRWWQRPRREAC